MARYFKKISQILIGFSSILIFSNPSFSEPPNLSLLREQVKSYHDSGLYQKELMTEIQKAHHFIIEQAQANEKLQSPLKLALVLDIDETSLSNYEKLVKRDFVGTSAEVHHEILAANSVAIKPMLALYRDALQHGIKVFFVTGRKESEREATKANLMNVGYANWSGLYLRPDDYPAHSIIPFKSKSREAIAKKGYKIVATIGDQYSDISGGFAEKGFKLPNPFYYLP